MLISNIYSCVYNFKHNNVLSCLWTLEVLSNFKTFVHVPHPHPQEIKKLKKKEEGEKDGVDF